MCVSSVGTYKRALHLGDPDNVDIHSRFIVCMMQVVSLFWCCSPLLSPFGCRGGRILTYLRVSYVDHQLFLYVSFARR